MLTVIKRIGTSSNRHILWLCVCECGNETSVQSSKLRMGLSKSCGCVGATKHGHTKNSKPSKIYQVWGGMIQRCTNPKNKAYGGYGGRGIGVCKRWKKFSNFLEDMGTPPSLRHTIERVNNNGDYCITNCIWATMAEQGRNRRNNRWITFDGKTQTISEWSREKGISTGTISYRLKIGWSKKKALTTKTKRMTDYKE